MPESETTIVGDSLITTWEDDNSFTVFVQPRLATEKEIKDAMVASGAEVGTFQGVRFIK